MLRHDRLDTTMIYLHAQEEDVKEAMAVMGKALDDGKPELKLIKTGSK